VTGYLILDDLSRYELDTLDPGQLADWRRQLRLARAVESDVWRTAGSGVDDAVDVELAVLVETGSAITDGERIHEIAEAAARAIRAGIYLDGRRVLERNTYGLLRTATSPMGNGWRLSLVLAAGPVVWRVDGRVTSAGEERVTSAGERRVYVEVY